MRHTSLARFDNAVPYGNVWLNDLLDDLGCMILHDPAGG
jgi:hypothetical protein